MSAPAFRARRAVALCALLGLATLASAGPRSVDIYQGALSHAGRPERDLKRDAIDHPAEVLRLAGIKPGMRVGDFMGASGYYSELLSYIVGPKGQVLLMNNTAYDTWSENRWQERTGRLANVEHRTIDAEHLDLPDRSLDAILLIKVYHDLYWVDEDPKDNWPRYDVPRVLNEIARVVKPGGILLLVDH
jgi:predicted methyltransferase